MSTFLVASGIPADALPDAAHEVALRPIDPGLLRALSAHSPREPEAATPRASNRYIRFGAFLARGTTASAEGSAPTHARSDSLAVVLDALPQALMDETSPVDAAQPGGYSTGAYDMDLHLRTVLRRDALDWNIAGGGGVDVLSELTWSGVQSRGLELAGSLTLPFQLVALGHASYGWIHEGENQDSDFDGPGRTLEFSRSNNDADGGATLSTSLALGYRIRGGPWDLEWTPLLGLAYHRQELEMTDGVQTIPNEGAFAGLNSRYDADWFGPWTGLHLGLRPHPRLALGFGVELHRMRYRGVANWNLRDDFAHPESFEHRADGWGWALQGSAAWKMTRRWTADLSARWMRFETDAGTDTLYFRDGTRSKTRLNAVNWESLQVVLGVTFEF